MMFKFMMLASVINLFFENLVLVTTDFSKEINT